MDPIILCVPKLHIMTIITDPRLKDIIDTNRRKGHRKGSKNCVKGGEILHNKCTDDYIHN